MAKKTRDKGKILTLVGVIAIAVICAILSIFDALYESETPHIK